MCIVANYLEEEYFMEGKNLEKVMEETNLGVMLTKQGG